MFNALKYTEELEKAGFTSEQAKASLKLIIEVMNEEFATKTDILEVKTEIKELKWEMDSKFQSIESKVDQLENRLTIKLGGMMVVTVGLAVTLMKLIS